MAYVTMAFWKIMNNIRNFCRDTRPNAVKYSRAACVENVKEGDEAHTSTQSQTTPLKL